MIVVVLFFLLLVLGLPIGFIILMSATAGVAATTSTSLLITIQQLFGGLDNYVLLAIPFFIIAGNLAAKGQTSGHLINVMNVFFGRLRGGPVIAAIFACTFFAAISGSSVATIVAIGSIMIPALVKAGYPEELSIGVICAAGSIGILIPPSSPMISICVAMETSVGKQFMAGFVPGVLLAIAWSGYVWFVSRQKNYGTSERYTLQQIKTIFIKAIPALIFPVIVLGSIYTGWATATEAAAVSVVYVLFIELFVYRTLDFKALPTVVYKALITSATVSIVIGCAKVLDWLITVNQIPSMIVEFLTTYVSSPIVFILLINVIFIAAGCFINLISLVVILSPILMPALAHFGVDPIHFGIIAIMNAQIGFLTPPFGTNLFVTMNISNRSLGQVSKATMPFTIILLLLTVVFSFIPQISLWLPSMMK